MQGNPALTLINQGYQKLEPVTILISIIAHVTIKPNFSESHLFPNLNCATVARPSQNVSALIVEL